MQKNLFTQVPMYNSTLAEIEMAIEDYAFAVANDERFRHLTARWNFWLLSDDLDENTKKKKSNKKIALKGSYFNRIKMKIPM